MQYSITNLNAFVLLITIGFSLYFFVEKKQDKEKSTNILDIGISALKITK